MNMKGLALAVVLVMLVSPVLPFASGEDSLSPDYVIMPPPPVDVNGYLSFHYDVSLGELSSVSLNGTLLIEKIELPENKYLFSSMEKTNGSFDASDYELKYISIGVPSISIVSKGDMKCSIEPADSAEVHMEKGSLRISVNGTNAVVVTDGMMESDGEIELSEGEQVIIRFYSSVEPSGDSSFMDAVSLSRIGSEVSIKGSEWSCMNYGNISVEPVYMEEKRWSFRVSSREKEGKCLVFHLEGVHSNVSVLLDNVPAEKGSYYDALFSTGDESVWNVTVEGNLTSVYVYIPSFSDHTVTITEEASSSIDTETAGAQPLFMPVIAAIVISAGAFFVMIRKKK